MKENEKGKLGSVVTGKEGQKDVATWIKEVALDCDRQHYFIFREQLVVFTMALDPDYNWKK